jgi:hypothetical protein
MEAVISLLLVVRSRFVTTWASRQVTQSNGASSGTAQSLGSTGKIASGAGMTMAMTYESRESTWDW